ncbi:MAG: PadR family transcriptional regulator [Proteobacteria bacterium]|nr:PadR family transcriptional regulator [Pseudomonadota bacterium]
MHPFFSRFHDAAHGRGHDYRGCHAGGGRRHRGFGAFFRDGDGPQGFAPGGLRAGRKLSGESLQLLILALLADKPRHGYEIIKELGERSGGFYTPSPGMVYPALTYLEETGLAAVAADGTKKLYSITADGHAHLEAHRAEADAMLQQLTWLAERMHRVRDAVDADTEGGGGRFAALGEIHAARHELKRAFAERLRHHASPEEVRRIAAILREAARAIRGDGHE